MPERRGQAAGMNGREYLTMEAAQNRIRELEAALTTILKHCDGARLENIAINDPVQMALYMVYHEAKNALSGAK
jgi:hypothetical protein